MSFLSRRTNEKGFTATSEEKSERTRAFFFRVQSQRGFTLLEILIVIAIIGILAAVVLASLNSSRVKARDAQRVAQLKEVEKALAIYYTTNGRYPAGGGSGDTAPLVQTSIPSALVTGGLLGSLPTDPIYSDPDAGYFYCSKGPDYDGYVLLANIESDEAEDAWCYISYGDASICINEVDVDTDFNGVPCDI